VTSQDLQPEYGAIGQDAIRPVKFYSRKGYIQRSVEPCQRGGHPDRQARQEPERACAMPRSKGVREDACEVVAC
jgi:hypothetical protein